MLWTDYLATGVGVALTNAKLVVTVARSRIAEALGTCTVSARKERYQPERSQSCPTPARGPTNARQGPAVSQVVDT